MILFLFLILIILVTICIYKNYFSNQEGNTIYVADCGNNQYIKDGVCTSMVATDTDLSGQCLDHSEKGGDYFNFSNILNYIGTKSQIKLNDPTKPLTYDSCNLDNYQRAATSFDVNNKIFNVNTSLLPDPSVTCKGGKSKKGNLYCKYNTAVDGTVITGDISCVDVSDFKDVEWYRNVANYSFEYTNDGSRNKLHYVCKNGTTINGDGDEIGSILASDWEDANFNNDSVKCKCPGAGYFYPDGQGTEGCNSEPEHSTIGEGGKNIKDGKIKDDHGPGDCKGRWLQKEKCVQSKSTPGKGTFKAEFVTEYGNVNGLPDGNYYSTSCKDGNGGNDTSFNSEKGVKVVGDKYEKDFDCDLSCGEWKKASVNDGCTDSLKWEYGYKDEYKTTTAKNNDISRNQCYFEIPNIPGMEKCYNDSAYRDVGDKYFLMNTHATCGDAGYDDLDEDQCKTIGKFELSGSRSTVVDLDGNDVKKFETTVGYGKDYNFKKKEGRGNDGNNKYIRQGAWFTGDNVAGKCSIYRHHDISTTGTPSKKITTISDFSTVTGKQDNYDKYWNEQTYSKAAENKIQYENHNFLEWEPAHQGGLFSNYQNDERWENQIYFNNSTSQPGDCKSDSRVTNCVCARKSGTNAAAPSWASSNIPSTSKMQNSFIPSGNPQICTKTISLFNTEDVTNMCNDLDNTDIINLPQNFDVRQNVISLLENRNLKSGKDITLNHKDKSYSLNVKESFQNIKEGFKEGATDKNSLILNKFFPDATNNNFGKVKVTKCGPGSFGKETVEYKSTLEEATIAGCNNCNTIDFTNSNTNKCPAYRVLNKKSDRKKIITGMFSSPNNNCDPHSARGSGTLCDKNKFCKDNYCFHWGAGGGDNPNMKNNCSNFQIDTKDECIKAAKSLGLPLKTKNMNIEGVPDIKLREFASRHHPKGCFWDEFSGTGLSFDADGEDTCASNKGFPYWGITKN